MEPLGRLIIIDEVHLLNDDRGAVIETVVARSLRFQARFFDLLLPLPPLEKPEELPILFLIFCYYTIPQYIPIPYSNHPGPYVTSTLLPLPLQLFLW